MNRVPICGTRSCWPTPRALMFLVPLAQQWSNDRDASGVEETPPPTSNKGLGACCRVDFDDSPVIQIAAFGVDCVRIPDDKLAALIYRNSHRPNQVPAF